MDSKRVRKKGRIGCNFMQERKSRMEKVVMRTTEDGEGKIRYAEDVRDERKKLEQMNVAEEG